MKKAGITGENCCDGVILNTWRAIFHERYERDYVGIINTLFDCYDTLVDYRQKRKNVEVFSDSKVCQNIKTANRLFLGVYPEISNNCSFSSWDELRSFSRQVDSLESHISTIIENIDLIEDDEKNRGSLDALKLKFIETSARISSEIEKLRPCIERIEIRNGHLKSVAAGLNLDTNSIEIRDRSIIHWATDSNFDSDDFLLNHFGLELFRTYTEMKVALFDFMVSVFERMNNTFMDNTIMDEDVFVSLGNDLKLIELAFGTVTNLFEKHMGMLHVDASLDNKNSAVDNSNFVNTRFLFLLCSFFRTYFNGGKIRPKNLSLRFSGFAPSYSKYFGGESDEPLDIDFLEQDPYLQEEYRDILEIYRCLENAISCNSLEDIRGSRKK